MQIMNVKNLLNAKNITVAVGVLVVLGLVIATYVRNSPDSEPYSINVNLNDAQASEPEGVLTASSRPYVPPVDIDGATFRLVSFNHVDVSAGQSYTLSFDGSIMAAKFCNSMGGDFVLSNGVIAANLITTDMLCSDNRLMETEKAFGSILSSGASFYVEGYTLMMRGSNGERFVFEILSDQGR